MAAWWEFNMTNRKVDPLTGLGLTKGWAWTGPHSLASSTARVPRLDRIRSPPKRASNWLTRSIALRIFSILYFWYLALPYILKVSFYNFHFFNSSPSFFKGQGDHGTSLHTSDLNSSLSFQKHFLILIITLLLAFLYLFEISPKYFQKFTTYLYFSLISIFQNLPLTISSNLQFL